MKNIFSILLILSLVQINLAHLKQRTHILRVEQTNKNKQTKIGNDNEQETQQEECKANPNNVMQQMLDHKLVMAKLDIALSLSSAPHPSNKQGFYCLCDFTIIKKVGDKLAESECDALPDTLDFLTMEPKHQNCLDHCNELFDKRLKCPQVKQC